MRSRPSWKATWEARKAQVSVVLPTPGVTSIGSRIAKLLILSTIITRKVGFSSGRVTCQMICRSEAPSMRAASYSSRLMPASPTSSSRTL